MRRGLILAGPPGTGKTLLGKVLADTLNVSFLWVSPRHVRNATSFQEIMSLARFVAPVVVFLEDLDLFAEEREGNKWMGLGELMNQLDGAVDNEDIVTIATTNRLDVIEKALRNRPGRFDRIVEIGALDERCRRELFAKLLSRSSISDGEMAHLISATTDYTGAQIQELANTIYILAVDDEKAAVSGGGSEGGCITVDRQLIDRAVNEFRVERKARLGFHAA
jgi:ATP-dependent 26S proteasome regulatory subunit